MVADASCGLSSHPARAVGVELYFARQLDNRFGMVPVFEESVFECLGSIDE
jgi:hypothetical protein